MPVFDVYRTPKGGKPIKVATVEAATAADAKGRWVRGVKATLGAIVAGITESLVHAEPAESE